MACPYTVKDHPLTEGGLEGVGGEWGEGGFRKKIEKGQMCVCADGAAVCLESLLVRGTAVIGGAHKSVESIGGHEKSYKVD